MSALIGAVLASLPWASHMHPGSMVRHADRAFIICTGFHSLVLLAMLTLLARFGEGVEVLAVAVWVIGSWFNFPNF